jgi:hypothetical protein
MPNATEWQKPILPVRLQSTFGNAERRTHLLIVEPPFEPQIRLIAMLRIGSLLYGFHTPCKVVENP